MVFEQKCKAKLIKDAVTRSTSLKFPQFLHTTIDNPFTASANWFFRFSVPLLQIIAICQADGTANNVQMKFDIAFEPRVTSAEKVATQFIASRTTEMLASPNCSEGMFAQVNLLANFLEKFPDFRVVPHGFFHRDKFGFGKCIV